VRTIEIDDEIYNFLLHQTNDFGESPSSVLARLLEPSKAGTCDGAKGTPVSVAKPPSAAVPVANGRISSFLNSATYLVRGNVVEKFLSILAWLQKDDPEKFEKVLLLRGRKRLYFAKTADELEASGNSVMPKRIPDSPFWVITNSPTVLKQQIIGEVMRMLGYDASSRQIVIGTLH
jgi:negative modulator of initiation of replication